MELSGRGRYRGLIELDLAETLLFARCLVECLHAKSFGPFSIPCEIDCFYPFFLDEQIGAPRVQSPKSQG